MSITYASSAKHGPHYRKACAAAAKPLQQLGQQKMSSNSSSSSSQFLMRLQAAMPG
jgi:hypothetical protein